MDYEHLQLWYEVPRELSIDEKTWLNKLFEADLLKKDILKVQLQHSKVIGECKCGCKSINIEIDKTVQQYPYSERIPVEMTAYEQDKAPIMFLLHVVEGYINELEVLRADSSPILEVINLSNTEVTVNIEC